jgi:hypothetical protein
MSDVIQSAFWAHTIRLERTIYLNIFLTSWKRRNMGFCDVDGSSSSSRETRGGDAEVTPEHLTPC